MSVESTRTIGRVRVVITRHGPLRRISLVPLDPPGDAQVSVYRVGDALIDTANSRVTPELLRVLEEDPPARIFLTHQHEDHVGNVAPILERFGAMPVFAPRALVELIAETRSVPPYRRFFWGDPHPIERAWLSPYDPGDELVAGPHRLRAIATPGHTPFHVAFALEAEGHTYALTGDLYASRPLDALFEAAIDDTIRSYRAVAGLAPDVVMLPTHGKVRLHGSQVLRDAADELELMVQAIYEKAEELGTRDPARLAEALYGEDPVRRMTGGEMGKAVFVRAVLEPVRALPATPMSVATTGSGTQTSGTSGST